MAGRTENENSDGVEYQENISQNDLNSEIMEDIDDREDADNIELVKRLNQNFTQAKTSKKTLKDATDVNMLSVHQRQRLQQKGLSLMGFEAGEFAEKLKVLCAETHNVQLESGPLTTKTWTVLGQHCQQYYKKSPTIHFMRGTFDTGEVVRKPVAKERKPKDNEVSKATEFKQLSSFQETSKCEATTKEVESVLQTLIGLYQQHNSPICYFEFVVNPFSFGQTVENMFYVSFLARDGFVSLSLDEDGLPVLVPLVAGVEETDSSQTGNGARHQIVMTITPAEWKEIIATFKIKQPLIKNRASRSRKEAQPSTSTSRS